MSGHFSLCFHCADAYSLGVWKYVDYQSAGPVKAYICVHCGVMSSWGDFVYLRYH